MEGWVDLGYPAMHRPEVELAITSPTPYHYTTEPTGRGKATGRGELHYLVKMLNARKVSTAPRSCVLRWWEAISSDSDALRCILTAGVFLSVFFVTSSGLSYFNSVVFGGIILTLANARQFHVRRWTTNFSQWPISNSALYEMWFNSARVTSSFVDVTLWRHRQQRCCIHDPTNI